MNKKRDGWTERLITNNHGEPYVCGWDKNENNFRTINYYAAIPVSVIGITNDE